MITSAAVKSSSTTSSKQYGEVGAGEGAAEGWGVEVGTGVPVGVGEGAPVGSWEGGRE